MSDEFHVVVFAGGNPGYLEPAHVPPHDFAIAADSGFRLAASMDIKVDLLIGDFDSISMTELEEAIAAGTQIEKHPDDKDQTDLELGLDRAMLLEPDAITVIGGAQGRFDHWVGNLMLMSQDKYAGTRLEQLGGSTKVTVIRGKRELVGEPGAYISLLPMNGTAKGITIEGLRYLMNDGELAGASVLGISNEFFSSVATVTVNEGVVIAIQPDALREDEEQYEVDDENDETGQLGQIDEALQHRFLIDENPGGMFN